MGHAGAGRGRGARLARAQLGPRWPDLRDRPQPARHRQLGREPGLLRVHRPDVLAGRKDPVRQHPGPRHHAGHHRPVGQVPRLTAHRLTACRCGSALGLRPASAGALAGYWCQNQAMNASIVEALLQSPEPAIRWKVRTRVLGEPADSAAMTALRDEVRDCALVRRLLAPLDRANPPGVYAKWQGAHWALGALADLGYPPGDEALYPLREQVLGAWLHEAYHLDVEVATKSAVYRHAGVPVMRGRHRAHASQQGYALWFLI